MIEDPTVLVIIPTKHRLTENLRAHIGSMLRDGLNLPFCIVDDSDCPSENKKIIVNLRKDIEKRLRGTKVTIFHFGKKEQERFFKLLGRLGVPDYYLNLLRISPSFGNMRNKSFLIANSLGARAIFGFDDDTRPTSLSKIELVSIYPELLIHKIRGGIYARYYNSLQLHEAFDPAALRERIGKLEPSEKYTAETIAGMKSLTKLMREKRSEGMVIVGTYHHKSKLATDITLFLRDEHDSNAIHKILRQYLCISLAKNELNIKDFLSVFRKWEKKGLSFLGGNFVVTDFYKSVVCPPVKRVAWIDEYFISLYAIRKKLNISYGYPIWHEYLKGRKASLDYAINYLLREDIGTVLFFGLLYKLFEKTRDLEPSRGLKEFIYLNKGWMLRSLVDFCQEIKPISGNMPVRARKLVSQLILKLSDKDFCNSLVNEIVEGMWGFALLSGKWPKIMAAAGKVNPADVFQN